MRFRYMSPVAEIAKTEEINIQVPQFRLPPGLIFGHSEELVLAIDPGTNGVGVSVGKANEKALVKVIQIDKNGGWPGEEDASQFTYSFVNCFLKQMCSLNSIKEVIIEEQFLLEQYKHSFKVLTSFTDNMIGFFRVNGINTIKVNNKSWKSTLLQHHPHRQYLNLTESNKTEVKEVVRLMFPLLNGFNASDAFDSVGILNHYYTTSYRGGEDDGVIKVNKDMEKDFRSKAVIYYGAMTKEINQNRIVEQAHMFARGSSKERKIRVFEPHKEYDIETNIRALIKGNNDIYVGATPLVPAIMPELMRRREDIKRLDDNSIIYMIGYRANVR